MEEVVSKRDSGSTSMSEPRLGVRFHLIGLSGNEENHTSLNPFSDLGGCLRKAEAKD